MNEWEPADSVAKNQAGEYQALIGGQWVPATAASKNDAGQYQVIRSGTNPAAPAKQTTPDTLSGQIHRGIFEGIRSLIRPQDQASHLMSEFDKAVQGLAYRTGGAVTDLAATHVPPEVAAGLGTAANFGVNAIPAVAGALIGSKAAPMMESAAKGTMGIAVNPSPQDLMNGKAAKAIDFMLKKDISPTANNMRALRNQIGELEKQASSVISNASGDVTVGKVGESLAPTFEKFVRAGDSGDITTIKKAWAEFRNHPMILGSETIPVQTAQSIKTAKGSMLDTRVYGEMNTAATEAEKSIVHGLKTQIAEKVPEIVPINELQSALRNVVDVSERKALMKLAHNPVDMAFVFSTPEHYAAYTFGRSKAFLGGLARIMYHNKESIPASVGAAAGTLYSDLKNKEKPENP